MYLFTILLFINFFVPQSSIMKKDAMDQDVYYKVYPIGKVLKQAGRCYLVIHPEYQKGLMGLEEFSHVKVIYWFHENDTPEQRSILQVHPRGNPENPIRGVFATHSPVRPNLLAISECRIIGIENNVVEIEDIDAYNNSPILDLKN